MPPPATALQAPVECTGDVNCVDLKPVMSRWISLRPGSTEAESDKTVLGLKAVIELGHAGMLQEARHGSVSVREESGRIRAHWPDGMELSVTDLRLYENDGATVRATNEQRPEPAGQM